jgi:hypothetical protein
VGGGWGGVQQQPWRWRWWVAGMTQPWGEEDVVCSTHGASPHHLMLQQDQRSLYDIEQQVFGLRASLAGHGHGVAGVAASATS